MQRLSPLLGFFLGGGGEKVAPGPSLHVGLWEWLGGPRSQRARRKHTSPAWSDGVLVQILGSVFVNFPLFVF